MEAIENPKIRGKDSLTSGWYKFYPGFSEAFARSVLSVAVKEGEWVLDPWNGAGTTTSTAASLGLNAHGYDLNPVMVIVSKARCLDPAEYSSLRPLDVDIRRKARKRFDVSAADPLLTWLTPRSVGVFRSIESAVQTLLVDERRYLSVSSRGTDAVSGLAAFFYVALFRALKKILAPFLTSNPTWLKRPGSFAGRLRPASDLISVIFQGEVARMLPADASHGARPRADRVLKVASSENIPLPGNSINCILSSPPYCTRIDYAVATAAELSLLGFGPTSGFRELRRDLIGGATVPRVAPVVSKEWGGTCQSFLASLQAHNSKASATYYYKSHVQYFDALARSVSEINRVLKPGGLVFSLFKTPTIRIFITTLRSFSLKWQRRRSSFLTKEKTLSFPEQWQAFIQQPRDIGAFSERLRAFWCFRSRFQEQSRSTTFPMSSSQSVATFWGRLDSLEHMISVAWRLGTADSPNLIPTPPALRNVSSQRWA